jgi:hypothetical protein
MEPSPHKIRGETRCIGRPRDWDESLDGSCGALSVRDEVDVQSGLNFMHSEWRLQPGELKLLQDYSGVVVLRISGAVHPVVSLHVEARATQKESVE